MCGGMCSVKSEPLSVKKYLVSRICSLGIFLRDFAFVSQFLQSLFCFVLELLAVCDLLSVGI